MSFAQQQPGDPLLEFRLAYLRAIAKSWSEPDYRDRLLKVKDIQPILSEDFGLRTIWPWLDVVLNRSDDPRDQTLWKPVLTAGWIGLDDAFEIVFPQAPSERATEALASYYQLFPTLMGASALLGNDPVPPQGPSHVVDAALPTGLGIPGGDPGSLLAFGGVVLRAIALAWQSKEFKAELLDPASSNVASVLSQWLGYNNPFNFSIKFVPNEALVWDASANCWNRRNPDGSLIKNRIVLNYPNAPEAQEFWPISLTSYNNTGSAYPFTC
ncbi:BMA_0021/BMA_0022 family TOMM bacteriocin [Paracidovorax anthurii]|uniref:Ribosomally synthesized peptide (Two-chain TOMM family) n=1 Tax=Paracidovorax anthurii TaxID=78229 RepID=A0A328Z8N6_9BURK|nr:BMA_0021/BMA_0022 family TOMM bacteriocin [Paracidovorax anthurii]RAR79147.1 ribosomally synthesized peptide (two-chain TOMM family) [Paracidovorax anthurii]